MGRLMIAFVVLALLVLTALPTLAYERNSPEYWDIREELRLEQYAAQERMDALADELKANSSWEWSPWLLECYYRSVVDYLYTWQCYQVHSNEVDYTLYSLCLMRGGQCWPKDPLNNWKRLPIQDIGDDPLPGGIVMQICPEERYNDLYCSGYPRPRSFEISIYAPDGLAPQRVRPRAGNRGWAIHRPEMLAMQGWFEPPYTLIDEAGYDMSAAEEWTLQTGQSRRDALDWFHASFHAKLPTGKNIALDLALSQIGSVLRMDRELAGLETRYAGIPPEQWAGEDLDSWYFNSLFLIYSSSFVYGSLDGSLLDSYYDLELLHSAGYMPRIPPNMFQDGRPVRILSPEDGFSPGELCLEHPTPYWAGCDEHGLKPRMNQLYIYGGGPDAEREAGLEEKLCIRDGTYKVPPGAKETVGNYSSAYLLNSDYRQSQCQS